MDSLGLFPSLPFLLTFLSSFLPFIILSFLPSFLPFVLSSILYFYILPFLHPSIFPPSFLLSSLLILLTNLLTSPILRLHSSLLHSAYDWRPKSTSYPIPILLQRHDTSTITTDCNCSPTLSPRLHLPGFWPGTETKGEVWLLRT